MDRWIAAGRGESGQTRFCSSAPAFLEPRTARVAAGVVGDCLTRTWSASANTTQGGQHFRGPCQDAIVIRSSRWLQKQLFAKNHTRLSMTSISKQPINIWTEPNPSRLRRAEGRLVGFKLVLPNGMESGFETNFNLTLVFVCLIASGMHRRCSDLQ
jgi:hypothetical protein